MGCHDEIAHPRIVREHDFDRDGGTASPVTLVENVGDGLGGEGAASVCLADGKVEIDDAEAIEQIEEPRGGAAEVTAV